MWRAGLPVLIAAATLGGSAQSDRVVVTLATRRMHAGDTLLP